MRTSFFGCGRKGCHYLGIKGALKVLVFLVSYYVDAKVHDGIGTETCDSVYGSSLRNEFCDDVESCGIQVNTVYTNSGSVFLPTTLGIVFSSLSLGAMGLGFIGGIKKCRRPYQTIFKKYCMRGASPAQHTDVDEFAALPYLPNLCWSFCDKRLHDEEMRGARKKFNEWVRKYSSHAMVLIEHQILHFLCQNDDRCCYALG